MLLTNNEKAWTCVPPWHCTCMLLTTQWSYVWIVSVSKLVSVSTSVSMSFIPFTLNQNPRIPKSLLIFIISPKGPKRSVFHSWSDRNWSDRNLMALHQLETEWLGKWCSPNSASGFISDCHWETQIDIDTKMGREHHRDGPYAGSCSGWPF